MLINPGKLKHTITIYSNKWGIDEDGFKTKTQTARKVRAYLESDNSSDHDYRIHDITSTKELINCVIRYTEINNNDNVEIDGVQYDVYKVEDIEFQKRFLRVTLRSV